MADRLEYRLKIEGYTPETMPMKRLAEYLSDFAILLGETSNVHLIAIEDHSTCPVVIIDREAAPKVHSRVDNARQKQGPAEAIAAIDSINEKLAADNTSANMLGPDKSNLLEFPGVKSPKPIEWPAIAQAGELYGIPIAIGGRKEMVPVHLIDPDGNRPYNCVASRLRAKEIAAHLFTVVLRVSGQGKWRRHSAGQWDLEQFTIESFEPIKFVNMEESLKQLRDVKAKWKELEDPLAVVDDIRLGGSSKPNGGIRQ